jgi:hypothetical protein
MATLDNANVTPTNGTRIVGFTSVASGGECDFSVAQLKQAFATVASTGSYTNLNDKPNFAVVATSGSYNDLTGKPDLTSVATLEYVTVTQNRTLQATDKNKVLHVTGTVNITLPNSISNGFSCVLFNEDNYRTQITVTTGTLKTKAINMDSQYGAVTVWFDGTAWRGVGDLT